MHPNLIARFGIAHRPSLSALNTKTLHQDLPMPGAGIIIHIIEVTWPAN